MGQKAAFPSSLFLRRRRCSQRGMRALLLTFLRSHHDVQAAFRQHGLDIGSTEGILDHPAQEGWKGRTQAQQLLLSQV